jgi:tRNA (guanine-N7-)-methyltransferase
MPFLPTSWLVAWMMLLLPSTASFRVGLPFQRGGRKAFGHPLQCSARLFSTLEEYLPKTLYTIDCPPTKPETLQEVVTKHCASLDQYLENKPIALHTREAFRKVQTIVPPNATLILDSGCGTGRSTRHLASMFPSEDYWILGIDRSLVRLERNHGFRVQQQQLQEADNEMVWRCNESEEEDRSKRANVLWIRAELVDFWRLLLQHQDEHSWTVEKHYLLYPNPYPKTKRLKSRWYAHPSFPLILQLGGEEIVVRSNWETYMQEFARSVLIAHEAWSLETDNHARPYMESAQVGPSRRVVQEGEEGWSNFERKMDKVGEPTFELVLKRSV